MSQPPLRHRALGQPRLTGLWAWGDLTGCWLEHDDGTGPKLHELLMRCPLASWHPLRTATTFGYCGA